MDTNCTLVVLLRLLTKKCRRMCEKRESQSFQDGDALQSMAFLGMSENLVFCTVQVSDGINSVGGFVI